MEEKRMGRHNLNTEELTKIIMLYLKISPEKRIYAQGYPNGIDVISAINKTDDYQQKSNHMV